MGRGRQTDLSRGTPVRLRGPSVINPPPLMTLAPGTRFGAYEILSQIGKAAWARSTAPAIRS